MQQRRFRPGDVLDDYCPRERRITDHAIVAMIDDHIKQTRCVVCDAEHEYKEGKVPPRRRKKAQSALFSQVLEGLQGPQPPAARPSLSPESAPEHDLSADAPIDSRDQSPSPHPPPANGHHMPGIAPATMPSSPALSANPHVHDEPAHEPDEDLRPVGDEGPVRRPLIRATLPRPEGQPVVTRAMPEFTIRQPTGGRAGQRGRRRGGHQQGQNGAGPMRFGRGGHGQGQRQHGGRSHGPHGGRAGGSRRGGKKR